LERERERERKAERFATGAGRSAQASAVLPLETEHDADRRRVEAWATLQLFDGGLQNPALYDFVVERVHIPFEGGAQVARKGLGLVDRRCLWRWHIFVLELIAKRVNGFADRTKCADQPPKTGVNRTPGKSIKPTQFNYKLQFNAT
jgi:hypothetical protein